MKAFEWKWGAIIGGAGFAWLVLSWALGFHARGIGMIQVTAGLSVILALVGYVLAFRSLLRREPETGFLEGLRSGALIAVVAASVAVLAQIAYFRLLNPGWTDYMVGETRKYYHSTGLDEAGVEAMAEGAKTTFGFASYAIQAGAGALVQGVVFSALVLAALRWLRNR